MLRPVLCFEVERFHQDLIRKEAGARVFPVLASEAEIL